MRLNREQMEELGFHDEQGYSPWLLNFYSGSDEYYIQIGEMRHTGRVLELPARCIMWLWNDDHSVDLGCCDEEAVRAIAECVFLENPDEWERWMHLPIIRRLAEELCIKIDPLLVMARVGEVEHQRALKGGKSA